MENRFYNHKIFLERFQLLEKLSGSPWINESFVIFDLEHTGGNSQNASVIEVAGIRLEKGRVSRLFHSFVKPNHLLPPLIERMTQIQAGHLENAPEWPEVYELFWSFARSAWLISHGLLGDRSFLKLGSQLTGLPLKGPWFCTQACAERNLPDSKTSLKFLANKYQFPGACHQASEDAVNTLALFRFLLSQSRQNKKKLLPDGFLLEGLPKSLMQRSVQLWDVNQNEALSWGRLQTHSQNLVTYFSENREVLGRFFWKNLFRDHLDFLAGLDPRQDPLPRYIQLEGSQPLWKGVWKKHQAQKHYKPYYEDRYVEENGPYFLQVDVRSRQTHIRAGHLRDTFGWLYKIHPGQSLQKALWVYRRALKLLKSFSRGEKPHCKLYKICLAKRYLSDGEIREIWKLSSKSQLLDLLKEETLQCLPAGWLRLWEKAKEGKQEHFLVDGFKLDEMLYNHTNSRGKKLSEEGLKELLLKHLGSPKPFWGERLDWVQNLDLLSSYAHGDSLCQLQSFLLSSDFFWEWAQPTAKP